MKVTKMEHPNEGVSCVVNTCHFYMPGNYCSAEKIQVQPQNASNTQETDCATFTPENKAQ